MKNFVSQYKQYFIKKFNWLYNKQFTQINKLKCANKTSIKNKKDANRYKIRKRRIKKEKEKSKIESMILNKSSFELTYAHKSLLSRGLNFAPTPYWSNSIEEKEWNNLIDHLRRCEWNNILSNDNNADLTENIELSNQSNLPPKLKLPKFNRPNPELLDNSMFIYRELVFSKLRNLKPTVTKLYRTNNNLNPDLLTALKELINLVKNKNIVICKADKDGKIIVLDFDDYINIMNRELKTFTLCSDINNNNVYKYFD